MRRIKLLLFSVLVSQMAFAGGMVTNTNQSAAYIRMLARDASTDVDAVFYNPAALTKLQDGFYVQLNNQTVIQSRTIENTYVNKTYTGDVFVPAVPTFFAVYKTGDWAFSGGFTIIGGGGSADFATGLPEFETPFKDITQALSAKGIKTTDYEANIAFNGSSIYYGGQAGATYKINDMVSVYAGARYVSIANSYEGHIKDVRINPEYAKLGYSGAMVSAPTFFRDLEAAATSTGDLEGVGTARYLGAATQDREVDVEQFGSGVTPILGVNLAFMEDRLNIGLKYEFATEMEVENYTYKDDTKGMPGMELGMFPDQAKVAADMPAFMSVGIGYMATEDFYITAGLHYYWDKGVDYGRNGWVEGSGNGMPGDADYAPPVYNRGNNEDWIESNSYELALGLQYDISEKISLSGGYLHASTSPALDYQSGLSYSLLSNTFSFGALGRITERFDIDLGILYTSYAPDNKEIEYIAPGVMYTETYDKSNVVFSIGGTYHFGGPSNESN
ncbi:MAG: hypothetical protein KAH10_07095 [Flavobacteriales bacterium]|nr:hypothetical protein [Flavobacteriales bacterium]